MYENLIEKLRCCVDQIRCGDCRYVKDCDGDRMMMSEAADAIEEHEKFIPRWVSVTERLPDNIDEEVLVCNEDYGKSGLGFATVAVYDGNGWLECWQRKTYLLAVTHWMPLPPEPPKEETC